MSEEPQNEIEKLRLSLDAQAVAYDHQAVAYKEFQVALAQINALLESVDERVVDVKDLSKEAFRDLVKNVIIIGQQLHHLIQATHVTDSQVMQRVDSLLQTVFEMNRGSEVSDGIIRALVERTANNDAEVLAKLNQASTDLKTLLVSHEETKETLKKRVAKDHLKAQARAWMAAILFLLGLAATLMQLVNAKLVFGQ